jgi:urea transport system ATP-binding protein
VETTAPAGLTTVLSVRNLRRSFAGIHALDGVDLAVDRGDLLGIIGPNGAGKSTLFNVITGLLPPSSGRVHLERDDITGLPPHRITRLGIGRKFQVPNVFDHLSVRQNLVVAARGRQGIPALLSRGEADLSHVEAILERLGLEAKDGVLADELSHGERQWLEIGALLANEPRILLLDEPTAGMTMDETRRTEALLRDLSEGHTVVVIEHNIRFIREVAKRVVVMHRGKVLTSGPIAQIEADDAVRDVYLGRSTT